jgi:hypothetical protein
MTTIVRASVTVCAYAEHVRLCLLSRGHGHT